MILASAAPRAGAYRGDCALCWTLRTTPSGAFVFSGSELGFNWLLDWPGVASPHWITASGPLGAHVAYPSHSQVRSPVE